MSVEIWIIMNVSSEKKGVAMTLLESVKAFFIINKYINQIHKSSPKSTRTLASLNLLIILVCFLVCFYEFGLCTYL